MEYSAQVEMPRAGCSRSSIGARDQERGVDQVAGGRRGIGQRVLVLRVVLHVEELRVGAGDVLERGVLGDVFADHLAVDAMCGRHRVELVQVLLAGA